MDSYSYYFLFPNNEQRNKQLWIPIPIISYFLNVKRMRTPGLKMAAVKI